MEEGGFITAAEQQEAAAQLLSFRHPGSEQIAPYFIEFVRQHLVANYGETMVYKGGLEIFTTLNVGLQKVAEQAIRKGLRDLDKRQGWRGPLGTQDLSTPTDPAASTQAQPQPLNEGDMIQGVVTKVAKDHVMVLAGGTSGRLAFADME